MYFRCGRVGIFLMTLVMTFGAASGQPASVPPDVDSPPADTCVLELKLPAKATTSVDGRSYGTKRKLVFRGLDPQRFYSSRVAVRFATGETEEHLVLIEGGRKIRLALGGPTTGWPELMLQTGDTRGPVAWSNDGRYVLSNSILCDAASGRQLRDLFAGQSRKNITSVAFSPDNRHVAVAVGGFMELHPGVAVFNVVTGRRVQAPTELRYIPQSVSYSKDGRYLAVVGFGTKAVGSNGYRFFGAAQIFDTSTHRVVRTIRHEREMNCGVLSPDGRHLFAGLSAGPIRSIDSDTPPPITLIQWDVRTGAVVRRFKEFSNYGTTLVISDDGRQLLASDWSGKVRLVDVPSGRVVRSIDVRPEEIHSVAVTADWSRVLTAGSERRNEGGIHPLYGQVSMWDLSSGAALWSHEERDVRIESAALSPDGTEAVVQGDIGVIHDAESGNLLRRLGAVRGSVNIVNFHPEGVRAEVDGEPNGRMYNMQTGTVLSDCESPQGEPVVARAYSPDGRYLVTGSWDHTAVVWDVATGRKLVTLDHAQEVHAVAFSPTGDRIATGSGNSDDSPGLVVWDAATGKALHRLAGHDLQVDCVAFSPDGKTLLSGESRAKVFLWDVLTGKQLRQFPENEANGDCLAFSPDGRWIATSVMWPAAAILWDAQTGRKVRLFSSKEKHAVVGNRLVFSPDGQLLVAAPYGAFSFNNYVTVWDVATGRLLRTLRGHKGATHDARFAPDGRQLITMSYDGMPILWDVSTGRRLATLLSIDKGKDYLALTPEGLFDGSQGARQQVTFRVGGGLNVVPVDRFFQDFYRPGLLTELIHGLRPLPSGEIGAKTAPTVRIVKPQRGGPIQTPRVQLTVRVTDRGGGVRGPRLVHNGATVLAPSETQQDGPTMVRTFDVALVQGENRIEVHAANEDGSWESEPAMIVLNYAESLDPPALYLVVIGIDEYAESSLKLNFAAADAKAISRMFQTRGRALYADDRLHVRELLNEQATRENIQQAFEHVAREARPQDTLALYMAGHGTMLSQRYYFVPHEFRQQSDNLAEDVRRQAIAGDELDDWISAVPALKRLVIYDTCSSGGALRLGVGSRNPFAFRKVLERMSKDQGAFVLAATAASDEAQEIAALGHGVLTYALLAALGGVDQGPLSARRLRSGEGDDAGVVTVRDWFGFAQDEVPSLTRTYLGQEQFVQFTGSGTNFVILAGNEAESP